MAAEEGGGTPPPEWLHCCISGFGVQVGGGHSGMQYNVLKHSGPAKAPSTKGPIVEIDAK